jgi:GH15 family glucan-1,4-alpha-glucosidase
MTEDRQTAPLTSAPPAVASDLQTRYLVFEKMLTYANHLGLYAEQIGSSGELLGNFPQAFTHLALISAAIRLDRELQRERPSRPKPRTT